MLNIDNFKAYNDTDLSQMELKDVLSYDDSQYEVNDTINMPNLNYNSMTKTTTNAEIKSSYLSEVKKNLMSYGAASISTFVGSSCMQYDFNLKKYIFVSYIFNYRVCFLKTVIMPKLCPK